MSRGLGLFAAMHLLMLWFSDGGQCCMAYPDLESIISFELINLINDLDRVDPGTSQP